MYVYVFVLAQTRLRAHLHLKYVHWHIALTSWCSASHAPNHLILTFLLHNPTELNLYVFAIQRRYTHLLSLCFNYA